MHITARSYLTSGIAALGAGAIALTPIQPLPDHMAAAPQRAVESLAVNLASTIDPITPWVDTLQTSFANVQTLLNFYLVKPFPLLQTVGANVGTYFGELTSGNAGLIPGQIENNIRTFFQAPWSPGTQSNPPGSDPAFYEGDFISNVPITNKVPFLGVLSQRGLYQNLPLALSADPELLIKLAPVLAFAANHYSGQVAGLVGPLLAPLVVLTRSFTAVGAFFQAGDVIGAINELINIPANVTNGVLNGAGYVDLTAVVNAIQPLPDTIKSIGLNLGGLISPPVPFEGTLDAPTVRNGGTLFDNIATEAGVGGLTVTTPGLPVSWFGSVVGLGQFLSKAMLVTPPAPGATVAAAAAAPAAAAATPAVPAVSAVPAIADSPAVPAVPAIADSPATPATPAVPATPAIADSPATPSIPAALTDTPAKAPAAVADTSAPAHRGGGGNDNDGGNSGGRGHRGAA